MKFYSAPWGIPLYFSSGLLVLLGFCSTFAAPWLMRAITPVGLAAFATWILPTFVLGLLPFIIRGYEITPDSLLIRRLFWTTRLSRSGLQSAEVVPGAMKGSLRLCGNGGGFAFTGWYRNKALGNYRAFVTDLKNTVVLRYATKTIVVSPGDAEGFVKELAI